MGKRRWALAGALAFWTAVGLLGCGGDIRLSPSDAVIGNPGPEPAEPGTPNTEPQPLATLGSQLWIETDPTGAQRHVVVNDELDFIGWWKEEHASGPPSYGLFSGGLHPSATGGRFDSEDAVTWHLPAHRIDIGLFAMDRPSAGTSRIQHGEDMGTLQASPLAHEALGMPQRSGRYAGELQLPGGREPVSLRWEDDGRISLVLTDLPRADCRGTGLATPKAGAPARVLAFEMVFEGTGCPLLSTGTNLAGDTLTGAIDTVSADEFVLFGFDGLRTRAVLLPARRVPEPALQGAWTGLINNTQIGFRLAVLSDWTVMGWYRDPSRADQAYGLTLSYLQPPAPGATQFGGTDLSNWIPLSPNPEPLVAPGFAGPLPVTESMQGQFASAATLHAVPIAEQALPMTERSGRYRGELQVLQRKLPAELDWGADGSLVLSLANWPACTGRGQAQPLQGGPARWMSFQLVFSGSVCPASGSTPLADLMLRGAVDAASGDAFVLFGLDSSRLVSLVLPAQRVRP